jgi:hypothetical protein
MTQLSVIKAVISQVNSVFLKKVKQKYCFGCEDFTKTTILLKRKTQYLQHSIYQVIFETFYSELLLRKIEKSKNNQPKIVTFILLF